jgi:enoyl-CoA hydratase
VVLQRRQHQQVDPHHGLQAATFDGGYPLSRYPDLGVADLRFEKRGVVAWCTVHRPERGNALTGAMYKGLGEALKRTEKSPDLEALVITGSGDVFIPGGDLKEDFGDPGCAPSTKVPFESFRNTSVPVVCAINGLCQASGLIFALLADLSIASSRARFRAPELMVGLPDPWLAAMLPTHIGMGRARDMVLTGRTVGAREARAFGLVANVVEPARLEDAAQDCALRLLRAAPGARKEWKRMSNRSYSVVEEAVLDRAAVGPEFTEGVAAAFDHRRPAWASGMRYETVSEAQE